jgi:hypothetical protein
MSDPVVDSSGHGLTEQLRAALRDLRIELAAHTARVADIAGLNDSDLAVACDSLDAQHRDR